MIGIGRKKEVTVGIGVRSRRRKNIQGSIWESYIGHFKTRREREKTRGKSKNEGRSREEEL